jgi:hypothetical protein
VNEAGLGSAAAFAEGVQEGGDRGRRVVAPHGDVIRSRRGGGPLLEQVRERPPLGLDQVVRL